MNIVDLILKIKKFGLENIFRRYYSKYPARVTNIEDPQNRYRVKLEVPDILDDKELANWAEPQVHAGQDETIENSSTQGKFIQFAPPKIGDWVWVEFRLGDIRNPIYSTGFLAENEKPDFMSDEKKIAVYISRYGHKITIDETEGSAKINLETNLGYQFQLDETENAGKILLKNGISGTSFTLDDADGAENATLLMGKSGNKMVFDDSDSSLNITVSDKTKIESGDVILQQPTIAIGDGTIELLKTLSDLVDKLGAVRVITPVGPAAPMSASAEWSGVTSEQTKIKNITGSF